MPRINSVPAQWIRVLWTFNIRKFNCSLTKGYLEYKCIYREWFCPSFRSISMCPAMRMRHDPSPCFWPLVKRWASQCAEILVLPKQPTDRPTNQPTGPYLFLLVSILHLQFQNLKKNLKQLETNGIFFAINLVAKFNLSWCEHFFIVFILHSLVFRHLPQK